MGGRAAVLRRRGGGGLRGRGQESVGAELHALHRVLGLFDPELKEQGAQGWDVGK